MLTPAGRHLSRRAYMAVLEDTEVARRLGEFDRSTLPQGAGIRQWLVIMHYAGAKTYIVAFRNGKLNRTPDASYEGEASYLKQI